MKHPALIDITAELLREFRHSKLPADRVLSGFLARKKFLGSKERRFVGDTFFHALRHLIRIDESLRTALENARYTEWLNWRTGFPASDSKLLAVWAEPMDPRKKKSPIDDWFDALRVALAADDREPGFLAGHADKFVRTFPFAKDCRFPEDRLRHILSRAPEVMRLLAEETRTLRLPLKHSVPDALWALLGYGLPTGEQDALGASLNKPAPACLRVNRLRTTREAYLAVLAEKGLAVRASTLTRDGIISDRRIAPRDLPDMRDGIVEFQDDGSQLVTELLDPQPGMTIVDACAGAGGKTLHLAACLQNQGRILAHDVAASRLENLSTRARAAGVTILEFIASPDDARAAADLVLVDAPCTGTGTMRRSPELKYRVTRAILQHRVRVQAEVLDRWADAVRPGGVLAYATCSLLHEENGAQVDAFLARRPEFRRLPFAEDAVPRRDMIARDGDIQLYPHRHGTDGFFLSRLLRAD